MMSVAISTLPTLTATADHPSLAEALRSGEITCTQLLHNVSSVDTVIHDAIEWFCADLFFERTLRWWRKNEGLNIQKRSTPPRVILNALAKRYNRRENWGPYTLRANDSVDLASNNLWWRRSTCDGVLSDIGFKTTEYQLCVNMLMRGQTPKFMREHTRRTTLKHLDRAYPEHLAQCVEGFACRDSPIQQARAYLYEEKYRALEILLWRFHDDEILQQYVKDQGFTNQRHWSWS